LVRISWAGAELFLQLAVDDQQRRLMRLHHIGHDYRGPARVDPVQMRLGYAEIVRRLDQLHIDLGQRLPEGARRVRQDEMFRIAVERDDGDLGRPGLHDFEMLRRQRRLRVLHHQRTLGRDLGANDLEDLDRQRTLEIKGGIFTGAEQLHEPTVLGQKGAFVVLDDHFEPKPTIAGHECPPLLKRGPNRSHQTGSRAETQKSSNHNHSEALRCGLNALK
jgi:hypothetical protein